VRVLNAGIDDTLRQPDVKDRLMALGFDIQTRSQADFAAYVKTEVEKWAQVIKATGIQPN
jgi:tripartite-type tricarboxylate transporter receptor subunit TctC